MPFRCKKVLHASVAAITAFIAVSYTHLDVYKRQGYYRRRHLVFGYKDYRLSLTA